ncbi:MAG: class I SAM-dependent methyltransferase [Nanoarchaeota archaeon]|nr:class I SAM-dependent methyltransferase [Nanoarchaeota archaeon]
MIKLIQKKVFNLIKKYRMRYVKRLLDSKSKTLLDIGCQDLFLYHQINKKYQITLADIEPKNKLIKKEDVLNLSFKDKSFDIVLCQEVLEHVSNPVQAISELKRVATKQLIITLPYEPFFTLFRFLFWDKLHLWAITPKLLKIHLGKPNFEAKFFFKRYYIGIWKIE